MCVQYIRCFFLCEIGLDVCLDVCAMHARCFSIGLDVCALYTRCLWNEFRSVCDACL